MHHPGVGVAIAFGCINCLKSTFRLGVYGIAKALCIQTLFMNE